MANLKVLDGGEAEKYLKAGGAGTDLDPHVVEHEAVQATHDDLNLNANLQVGNVDVASGNPVPVSDAGGSLTVDGPLTDTQLRATPVPVSGGLTDAELRATAVPVSGTVTASGPLTDTQLRATAVPVSGTVTASGPLTDTQLRASAVPVSAASLPLPSGAATAALQGGGMPAALGAGGGLKVDGSGTALPVSGPLTDTQLRATAVPVSGTVTASGPLTDTQLRATAVPVSGTVTASGPLTDTQLRASAVPVSAASLPLPTGAATAALQGGGLPAALGAGGGLKVDGSGTALPVSISGAFTVAGLEDVLEVTLSTDTAAYASGDVLADTQEIASAFSGNGKHLTITSIVAQDQSDQGYGFDLVFLSAANSLGTENSAPNITDANGTAILGIVPVGQSDWIDLGAFRIATLMNISLGPIEAAAGSSSLWVGAISRGTGTYAADAIRLKISVVRD